jgi:hypothetical protein
MKGTTRLRASRPIKPDEIVDGYAAMLSEELSAAPKQRMRKRLHSSVRVSATGFTEVPRLSWICEQARPRLI